ncbi:hypothetical protein AB0I54_31400 [Streptomyces sp. NPDC050625]|uniref:hypothetical protein n=1 Tax=Streptomyces sp. NPDC050625 TaxID=3154629 RepID=UPI003439F093
MQQVFLSQPARTAADRYEAYRYQVTNGGLIENAVDKCLKETIIRKKQLKKA